MRNIWKESSWNSLIHQVKKNIKNGYVSNLKTYPLSESTVIHEHQKKRAKQLNYLFEYYPEKEMIIY